MQNLPDLYVFEIAFYTKDNKPAEDGAEHMTIPVRSQKLRYKCLLELLGDKFNMNAYKKRVAINLDAGRGWLSEKSEQKDGHKIVDHLILPLRENDRPRLNDTETMLKVTKMGIRKTNEKRDIYYKCIHKQKLKPENNEQYLRCFDIQFRTYASIEKEDSPKLAKTEFLYEVQEISNVEPTFPFPVFGRCRPVFDFDKTSSSLKVHMDVDLVPVMRKGRSVVEVLETCFGSAALIDGSQEFTSIKKMLCGIRVLYQNPKQVLSDKQDKTARTYSTGQGVALSPKTASFQSIPGIAANGTQKLGAAKGKENQDPRAEKAPLSKVQTIASSNPLVDDSDYVEGCFIRDIKPAYEMSRIFAQSVSGYKSVKEIVRKWYNLDPKNNKLPFANIGRKREYWVPLESLHIAEDQILRKCGQFASLLRNASEAQRSVFVEQCKRLPNKVFSQVRQGFTLWASPCAQSEVEYWSPVGPKKETYAQPNQKREMASSGSEGKDETLMIIYVSSHDKDPESFLKSVKDRLEHDKQTLRPFSSIQTVKIDSLGDLIRQSGNLETPLMSTARSTQCSVALGIIDKNGIDKTKYREIQAELRRTGDRKFGAVTMCVEKQGLESLLKCEHQFGFPANILRKINLMLGYPVWKTDVDRIQERIENFDPERCIILGAHVSHPDPVSTERCPSVAAVVGSLDREMLMYPGSARLQTDKPMKGHCQIFGLEQMAVERFQAWKEERGDYTGPGPTVFFYRGAYDTRYGEAFPKELQVIKNAHRTVFGADTPDNGGFAYIVVSKNLMRHWTPTNETDVPFTFTTTPNEEARNAAKYQYHVLHNSTGHVRDELAQLVSPQLKQLDQADPLLDY
jgi:hypothetical protein